MRELSPRYLASRFSNSLQRAKVGSAGPVHFQLLKRWRIFIRLSAYPSIQDLGGLELKEEVIILNFFKVLDAFFGMNELF